MPDLCQKYNADLTLSTFGAALRDKADIDQVTSQLISVVDETMQPGSLSLWLKDPKIR